MLIFYSEMFKHLQQKHLRRDFTQPIFLAAEPNKLQEVNVLFSHF